MSSLWNVYDCMVFIPMLFLAFCLFLLFRILRFRRKWSDKKVQHIFRIVMLIFACIFITAELMKILALVVYLPKDAGDWKWLVPLHICSYFMWFMLAIAIAKPNTLFAKLGTYCLYSVGGMLILSIILAPNFIYGNILEQLFKHSISDDKHFYGYYSIFYHSTFVLLIACILGVKPYRMGFKDWWKVLIIFLALLLITIIVSATTDFQYEQYNPTIDFLIKLESKLTKAGYYILLSLLYVSLVMLPFVLVISIRMFETWCYEKYKSHSRIKHHVRS